MRKTCLLLIAPLLLWGCEESEQAAPSLERAKAMIGSGDAIGGEVMLEQLLASGTAREDIAAYMGEAKLKQGELNEAQKWLGEGKFSPDSAAYGYRVLGWLNIRRNDLPAAGRAYDESHRIKPDDPELWVDIGRLRYRGGEQVQAVEASQRAVELGPENPAALEFRAQLIRDSKGAEAALEWFERALQHAPDNAALLGEYAATLGELGRAKDMLVAVRRITERDRRNPKALYLQAVLAARAGNDLLAQRLMQLTDDYHRNMPAGRMLSGIIDLRSGNYASAAQTFDKLYEMQPDNRRARQLLARALSLSGSHRELVHRFGAQSLQPGGSPYLAMSVGRSLEALGKREEAAQYLDRAAHYDAERLVMLSGSVPLEVAEKRGIVRGMDALSLVRGLISIRNNLGAVSRAEAFHERYPGSADALSLAGDAWLVAGNPGRALERYQQSANVRRPWPLARRMVVAHRRLGADAAAREILASELAGHPANSEAAAMLAQDAFDRGDFAGAATLLDQALANGAGRDSDVLDLRAQTAMRLGDAEGAQDAARRAYEMNRSSRRATETYSAALKMTDPQSEAAAALTTKAETMMR